MEDHRYDDILALPHPVSSRHQPLSSMQRAAQFAPFAALSGFDEEISETARLTDPMTEPGDAERMELDEKLRYLLEACPEHPMLTVTYFQPDEKKEGGRYVTAAGALKKLRLAEREMILAGGIVIPLDAVLRLEGPCFSALGV